MFNITSGLRRLRKAGQAGGGYDSNPQSFSFNGTNGYIQQVGYSGGVVSKQNDGTRDYRQCYGGYFNIGDSTVHGLDNRSVQTMKFVGQLDNILSIQILASYASQGGFDIHTSGAVRAYLPGTGSVTISSNTTISPGSIYNVIVRINNTLPSGTARVTGDADIFISGTKSGTSFVTGSNNTANTSNLGWGGSTTGAQPTFGRLYNFSLWNRALSDAECQAEGLSNRSVVTPSGLVNTRDTTDTSQAISRTGYNLTGEGNYSVATDAGGKYINTNGNRDATASTGTIANLGITSGVVYNQNTSFSWKTKVKVNTLPPNNVCGIFGSNFKCSLQVNAGTNNFVFTLRGSSTVQFGSSAITLGSEYQAHFVYDATVQKFYCYINGTLINTGGTAGPTTFATSDWNIGDFAIGGSIVSSASVNHYHARVRARALTQSDINADIALGNNINNDPTIIASYRPDNLINWQGVASPSNYTSWAKVGSTTATNNTTVAPDGTTTAGTVAISGTATQGMEQFTTDLTGSSLASKTFIVKAFVKVDVGTAMFRIKNTHRLVADYFSANLTATTTWQEFTFTQTFTSATNGTGITYGIINDTGATNPTLQVRNVRVFLVNEILYDNSPNIGGYVGPLVNRYIGGWIKPGVDAIDDASGNPIMNLGYGYSYIRGTTNNIRIRYDNRIGAIERVSTLGTGFRNWVHFIGGIERDGTAFRTVLYLNGVLIARTALSYLDASHALSNNTSQIRLGRLISRYFTGSMRDNRVLTSPTALTNAQALMITNGGDPMDITKVLHRDALPSDTTNYVTDKSGNGRVGYITGGVTKTF